MATYRLPVWDTITLGWQKTYGIKGSFWIAFIIVLVFSFVMGFIQAMLKELTPGFIAGAVILIMEILYLLLQLGLMFIGLYRALDLPVSYTLVFKGFEWDYAIRVIGFYVLLFLITIAVIICAALPLIVDNSLLMIIIMCIIGGVVFFFLMIRLSMALLAILDIKANPIHAMKLSWEATRGNFWNIVGVILLEILFLIVGILTLGIGLIWVLPFTHVTYGVMYKNLMNNLDVPAVK